MPDSKKDEKKDDKTAAAPAPASRKKPLIVVGGVVTGLALAFLAALAALPEKAEHAPQLDGPFVGALTPNKIQVNLSDAHSFLVLELNVLYDAYEPAYLSARTADPVCNAEIRDALVALASSKSRADVSDKVNKPVFLEGIRQAIEPLLFPVHLGGAAVPSDRDDASGLLPGRTMAQSSFRGLFEEHVIHVDAVTKTVRLDEGEAVAFTGSEDDLMLTAPDQTTLSLDLSEVDPDFRGEVKVGVKGRTRRVLWNEILIQ